MPEQTPDSSVRTLRGVGEARARALERMGLLTLRDLIFHFPRSYQNRGNIRALAEAPAGEHCAFRLTVATEPKTARIRGRMSLTKFRVFDETGTAEAVFFNQPYVSDVFHVGDVFRFWGTLSESKKHRQILTPQYEQYRANDVLPDYISLYPTCAQIPQKTMAVLVSEALRLVLPEIPDPLPEDIRTECRLPTLAFALTNLHHPTDGDSLNRSLRRLAFDELFNLGLGISLSKSTHETELTDACPPTSVKLLTDLLPYQLTNAQKRAINEIYADMTGCGKRERIPAMRRILIGDVGCGKTVCAAAAILIAAAAGRQSALMVPTSVLAEQHHRELSPLFSAMGYDTALLTGATGVKEKREILARLADRERPLSLIIGTHALLNEKVMFSDLALTVTDEQHRFGMMQRAALKEKYTLSHTLVMSATPIPRTLAHVLYGDLSVSRIDEMPAGRQRVDTFVVGESYRERLNAFIRRQVGEGGQVYIVCPAIEETEEADEGDSLTPEEFTMGMLSADRPPLKNAVEYAANLSRTFPDLPVTLLHGKMKQKEKEAAMAEFVSGRTKILVSTTVIEVGVNVPNATLMIVENADRFGLSQLHQLRGRVGRGTRKSYCVLVSDSKGETARERLEIMRSTYDGYEIAERDLALRGPGDFFSGIGTEARQSGGLSLRLASCSTDTALLELAFNRAAELVRLDPALSQPEHQLLKSEVSRFFTLNENTIS